MIDFGKDERAYLMEMRALTTDSCGQEIFVGLTHEESIFYANYSRDSLRGTASPDDSEKYLALNQKHEIARLAVIGAEVQLRVDNPPRH